MIPKTSYPRFFAAHRAACLSLGYTDKQRQDEYYRKVCLEEARVLSVKSIATQSDLDRCIQRFEADSGNFQNAVELEIENQKRRAYVVKVLCCQIMQLEQIEFGNAYAYFEGVLKQSKLGLGFRSRNASYFMDIPALNLHKVLQILDTHLRRLKKRLAPDVPKRFNDKIRFYWTGTKWGAEDVDKFFYSSRPFYVQFK